MLARAEIEAIAHLARLALTDAELDRFAGELTTILDHVAALAEVDTTGVEPMTHAQDMTLRLRPDEVAEPDRRDDYQRNAPAVEQGLFLVPRVIE